ncbi:MAG TPA: chemotaxis protein CheB [Gaiellaceae bacterium]|jgi:two-component system chemotaxis response regulator CheB|nr:chemotaxis protein CheB [Gaiellaceae bacterium]
MSASGAHELVAIGASWGGLDVLREILRDLPAELNAGVVIAQHRSPESHPTAMRDLLGAVTRLRVAEAGDKDEIRPGTAYLAAPDYHLLIEPGQMTLSTDEPVLYARPSIDVLFETAAESYRERCIGVVLTGANDDGARGLARVIELGGTAIVQDPEEATRDEMPRAALRAAPSARVAPVAEIAPLLVDLCGLARVPV